MVSTYTIQSGEGCQLGGGLGHVWGVNTGEKGAGEDFQSVEFWVRSFKKCAGGTCLSNRGETFGEYGRK